MTMRDVFFDTLYDIAKKDRDVILLSGDLGAPSLDKFRRDLDSQYFNMGIAEQSMASIASGLALSGKKVFMYSIIPFITLRCLEQIKIDICCMNLPVTILGVGVGYAYEHAGITHYGLDDIPIMNTLPNITILSPCDNVSARAFAKMAYELPSPKYIRLDRAELPLLYDESKADFSDGMSLLKEGNDLVIISTGFMVHRVLKVAEELKKHGIDAGVIDLYCVKPLNSDYLIWMIGRVKKVVIIEEGILNGGIGSIVASTIADYSKEINIRRFGVPEYYVSNIGSREGIHRLCGLDADSIAKYILGWLTK